MQLLEVLTLTVTLQYFTNHYRRVSSLCDKIIQYRVYLNLLAIMFQIIGIKYDIIPLNGNQLRSPYVHNLNEKCGAIMNKYAHN